MDLADVLDLLDDFGSELDWLAGRGDELLPDHPVELSVDLVLVTGSAELATRLGFRAA
jgi:hypothetical protein